MDWKSCECVYGCYSGQVNASSAISLPAHMHMSNLRKVKCYWMLLEKVCFIIWGVTCHTFILLSWKLHNFYSMIDKNNCVQFYFDAGSQEDFIHH